jgi:hypothetical protein
MKENIFFSEAAELGLTGWNPDPVIGRDLQTILDPVSVH